MHAYTYTLLPGSAIYCPKCFCTRRWHFQFSVASQQSPEPHRYDCLKCLNELWSSNVASYGHQTSQNWSWVVSVNHYRQHLQFLQGSFSMSLVCKYGEWFRSRVDWGPSTGSVDSFLLDWSLSGSLSSAFVAHLFFPSPPYRRLRSMARHYSTHDI